jgi:hypothetical protein
MKVMPFLSDQGDLSKCRPALAPFCDAVLRRSHSKQQTTLGVSTLIAMKVLGPTFHHCSFLGWFSTLGQLWQ